MAKRARNKVRGKGTAVEFELVVLEAAGGGNFDVEAELVSPALDGEMHPGGKVSVGITAKGRVIGEREGYVLDSFMLESVREYLRRQGYVRRVLERELALDQEEWDPEGEPVRGEVWSWARVRSLNLRPREVPTAEELRRYRTKFKYSAREIREMVSASDRPETRSAVTVTIKVDWDAEHVLDAEFRDGKFAGLSH